MIKKFLIGSGCCLLSLAAHSQVGEFSGRLFIDSLHVQSSALPRPQGVELLSMTTPSNNQATAFLGIHRKNYMSTAGTGNDRTDQVGIWIKGYYQGLGQSMPIYLGGAGFSSEDSKMSIDLNGNIGIGTTAPIVKLSIFGPADNDAAISLQSNGNSRFYIQQGGPYLKIGGITPGGNGAINIVNNGNVGIGTMTPNSYKLAVEGTLGARKVKVTQAAWADYVFNPEYELPALQDVETFIKQNRHLPDIPSAAEVEKEGLDLGEMDKRLLQKIEELTLYIIEMKKEINELKAKQK